MRTLTTLILSVLIVGCSGNPTSTTGTNPHGNTIETGNSNFKDFTGVPPIPEYIGSLSEFGHVVVYGYVSGDCQDTVMAITHVTSWLYDTLGNYSRLGNGATLIPTNTWFSLSVPEDKELRIVGRSGNPGDAGREWSTGEYKFRKLDTLVFHCP